MFDDLLCMLDEFGDWMVDTCMDILWLSHEREIAKLAVSENLTD